MRRGIVFATALLLAGCSGVSPGRTPSRLSAVTTPATRGISTSGASTTYDVTYEVSGATSANSITFRTAGGDISQDNGAALPWTKDLGPVAPGAFVYVSAQNNGGGTITCSILVDGTKVKSTDAHGKYAICSASGTL